MAFTGIEGAINAVSTFIQTNIAAKLAALDTEYADSITLAEPLGYFVGEGSLESIAGWPAVFVLGDATTADMLPGRTELDGVHAMRIGIMVIDQNAETLRRRIYRYIRAFIELIRDAKAAGSLAGFQPIDTFNASYASVFQEDQAFSQSAQLSFAMQQVETI